MYRFIAAGLCFSFLIVLGCGKPHHPYLQPQYSYDGGDIQNSEPTEVPGGPGYCGYFLPGPNTSCPEMQPLACSKGGGCCPSTNPYFCDYGGCFATQDQALHSCGSACLLCAAAPNIR
jgi:hypothetical protein